MSDRNLERASFLKSRRHRLTPEQVGLPRSGRRRIASLRREDVAWLADVGITWYTWLEQGRPIKIAADTLDRIAVALRLDLSESEYLRKLVHAEKPRPNWDTGVADRVQSLVESYGAGYAFVMSPRWDVLACNDRYRGAFGFSEGTGLAQNALWSTFTDERSRSLFPDWNDVARRMVATLRVEQADYAGNGQFAVLIEALAERSPEFVAMWADVEVLSPMRWSVGEIREPESGRVVAHETVTVCIPDSPGQTLVFYVPTQCALVAPVAELGDGQ